MRRTSSGAAETGEAPPERASPFTHRGLSGSLSADPSGGGEPVFSESLEAMKAKVAALDQVQGDVEAMRELLMSSGEKD